MRALVFRSAYSASRNARASAAFAASIKAHRAVSSKTLMLQVRCAHPPMPHRTSSSSCSGVPVGLFSEKALQLFLQNARPSGSLRSPSDAAPEQLFELFRCYAWLIFRKEYTVLFSTKRSCFRIAALTLRVSSHRNALSGYSGAALTLRGQGSQRFPQSAYGGRRPLVRGAKDTMR